MTRLLQLSSFGPVAVLDLRTDRNQLESVDYHNGDISSKADVMAVLRKVQPRTIIHVASPPAMLHDHRLYDKVNIDGTRTLVECAQQLGSVRAFVYTSSASVVHDSVNDLVMADESLPVLQYPQQTEYYSHTKGVAEGIVLAANRSPPTMLTTAIRPAGIFGEADYQNLAKQVEAARAGKFRFQMGDGRNLFDFTYVGNVAHAHIVAAEALLRRADESETPASSGRVDGQAFFITNDEPRPFWDFARAVAANAGFPVAKEQVWVIPKSVGLVIATIVEWIVWLFSMGTKQPTMSRSAIKFSCMTRTYCIDRAKRDLGYRPVISLDEGIKRGVQWFLEHDPMKEKAA